MRWSAERVIEDLFEIGLNVFVAQYLVYVMEPFEICWFHPNGAVILHAGLLPHQRQLCSIFSRLSLCDRHVRKNETLIINYFLHGKRGTKRRVAKGCYNKKKRQQPEFSSLSFRAKVNPGPCDSVQGVLYNW